MVSRFRVKKLSPKHPLPIFKEYQLPDLQDAANAQRSVPQIETGVEKEEEEEVIYHSDNVFAWVYVVKYYGIYGCMGPCSKKGYCAVVVCVCYCV